MGRADGASRRTRRHDDHEAERSWVRRKHDGVVVFVSSCSS
jgi:hypothetical protein